MALVVLKRFATSIDASLARSFLATDGIETYLFDVENDWDTAYRATIPVRLMVAEEDLDEAALLLRSADTQHRGGAD